MTEGIEDPLLQNADGVLFRVLLHLLIFNLQPTPVIDTVQEATGNSIDIIFNGPGLNIPNETANVDVALETLANELSIFKDSDSSEEIVDSIVGVTEIGADYIKVDLDLTAIYNSGVVDGDELYICI